MVLMANLSIEEVAALSGLSQSYISRQMTAGKLKRSFSPRNGLIVIAQEDYEAWQRGRVGRGRPSENAITREDIQRALLEDKSQAQIARDFGVSQATISYKLNGKRR